MKKKKSYPPPWLSRMQTRLQLWKRSSGAQAQARPRAGWIRAETLAHGPSENIAPPPACAGAECSLLSGLCREHPWASRRTTQAYFFSSASWK